MQTQFLRIKTADKLLLPALLYTPDTQTKKALLHIHGMAGDFHRNSFFDFMAPAFTEDGYAFFTPNNRGADMIVDVMVDDGKPSYRRLGATFETFEECIFDIKEAIDHLETQGFEEIVLQGHSLGAVKVAYYMAITKDKRISKLILLSPPDMVGLAEADKNHQQAFTLSQKLVAEGKGKELLSTMLWNAYYLCADTYLNLSTRGNPIDVFNVYDRNAPSILKEISLPVLAVFGGKDAALISPTEDLEILRQKAPNASRFDTAVIPGAPHSYYNYEAKLVKEIVDWLKK